MSVIDSPIYKEQTTEYALGRVVDINTRVMSVGRDGWVRWRLEEYFPPDTSRVDRADRWRARLMEGAARYHEETFIHWPTLQAMLGDGSAIME